MLPIASNDKNLQQELIDQIITQNPLFSKSRLVSLYSNFGKLQQLNPEGYQANISAWTSLLHDICSNNGIGDSNISLTTHNLSLAHSLAVFPYGEPKSLDLVLDELVSNNKMVPYSLYIAHKGSYLKVINPLAILDLFSPANWVRYGLRSIGIGNYKIVDSSGTLIDERYVSWELLTKLAEKLYNYVRKEITKAGSSVTSKLFGFLSLYEFLRSKDDSLTELDLSIVLLYWSRDTEKCQTRQEINETYIKFDKEPITDLEVEIVNVKSAILNLKKRNTSLESKIEEIETTMKSVLTIKSKSEQKDRLRYLLGLKNVFTKSLNLSYSSYSELSSILLKIEDSHLNSEIYAQLVSSSKLLKDLNSKIEISDIDDVKLAIEEEMTKTDEISLSLEQAHIEDSEIEEELEKLHKEESETNEEDSLLNKLENLKINNDSTQNIDSDSTPRIDEQETSSNQVELMAT